MILKIIFVLIMPFVPLLNLWIFIDSLKARNDLLIISYWCISLIICIIQIICLIKLI